MAVVVARAVVEARLVIVLLVIGGGRARRGAAVAPREGGVGGSTATRRRCRDGKEAAGAATVPSARRLQVDVLLLKLETIRGDEVRRKDCSEEQAADGRTAVGGHDVLADDDGHVAVDADRLRRLRGARSRLRQHREGQLAAGALRCLPRGRRVRQRREDLDAGVLDGDDEVVWVDTVPLGHELQRERREPQAVRVRELRDREEELEATQEVHVRHAVAAGRHEAGRLADLGHAVLDVGVDDAAVEQVVRGDGEHAVVDVRVPVRLFAEGDDGDVVLVPRHELIHHGAEQGEVVERLGPGPRFEREERVHGAVRVQDFLEQSLQRREVEHHEVVTMVARQRLRRLLQRARKPRPPRCVRGGSGGGGRFRPGERVVVVAVGVDAEQQDRLLRVRFVTRLEHHEPRELPGVLPEEPLGHGGLEAGEHGRITPKVAHTVDLVGGGSSEIYLGGVGAGEANRQSELPNFQHQ
mmetsp:Transcript_40217/g.124272  ORF Transcript_40217/g.124272 Transcript_40217/m.124272 type:complete len:468 (-) Transcript_40217:18-1421(-)